MYLYIKNWNIIHRSDKKKLLIGFLEWCQIMEEKNTDRCIYEDWKIIKYEKSKQWENDSNKYHLKKELEEEKRKNNELITIANKQVTKGLWLDKKRHEPTEYYRKLYLLKSLWNANAKESME